MKNADEDLRVVTFLWKHGIQYMMRITSIGDDKPTFYVYYVKLTFTR